MAMWASGYRLRRAVRTVVESSTSPTLLVRTTKMRFNSYSERSASVIPQEDRLLGILIKAGKMRSNSLLIRR